MSSQIHTFIGPASKAQSFITTTLSSSHSPHSATPSPNLTNAIHPLFSFSNFRHIPKLLYKKMKPALQLASLWLTDDRLLDWFYHNTTGALQFGTAKNEPESWPFLAPSERYKDMKTNLQQRAAVRKLWLAKLKDLSKVLTIYMYEGSDKLDLFGCTYDVARDLKDDRHNAEKLESPQVYQDVETREWRSRGRGWPYTGCEKTKPAIMLGNIFRVFLARMPVDIACIRQPKSSRSAIAFFSVENQN
jgi:hypothetical protein